MRTVVHAGTLAAFVFVVTGSSSGRGQTKVDFARDVQPLLKERCFECHGPTKQMNGYRLDRRSVALAGVTRPNIVPHSSESSRLYRRILSPEFGTQMPPDDPLARTEVEVLKRWIDEGAEWPDALANERQLPPQDPVATRITALIRSSQHKLALDQVARTPSAVNGRGPGGSTPLMFAVLHGDAKLVGDLLNAGADPNLRNDAGASALAWAVDDVEKVGLLLVHGADVNAATDFGRLPLNLASAQPDSAVTVQLLLKSGAKPTTTALTVAAARGDATTVRLLLAAGARDTENGIAAATALRANCLECLDAILASAPPSAINNALLGVLPPAGAGHPDAIRAAIERGAKVDVRDAKARTTLMLAAISETLPPASTQLLIERGVDMRIKDANGLTALDFAKRLGHTPVVEALVSRGATSTSIVDRPVTYVQGNTVRDAIGRSLPLLQRTATQFYEKSGCVSCHHNALTAMTVAAARSNGFVVNETAARRELTTVVKDIEATREQALQGIVSPGGFATTVGYILVGLAAERHPPSDATDAMVRLLKNAQSPDGRWRSPYRPPSESSEFTATAVSLRGIREYGRGLGKQSDADAIRAAMSWLERTPTRSTEDRTFRLLGLTWGQAPQQMREAAVRDLVATQRSDGGWAQLPSMQSDAYATGQALVALHEGGIQPRDPKYRRGVEFLLRTQLVDGSWFVQTRSHQTQIYFESGFPHGRSQFISAAATNWATRALIVAGRAVNAESKSSALRRRPATVQLY